MKFEKPASSLTGLGDNGAGVNSDYGDGRKKKTKQNKIRHYSRIDRAVDGKSAICRELGLGKLSTTTTERFERYFCKHLYKHLSRNFPL